MVQTAAFCTATDDLSCPVQRYFHTITEYCYSAADYCCSVLYTSSNVSFFCLFWLFRPYDISWWGILPWRISLGFRYCLRMVQFSKWIMFIYVQLYLGFKSADPRLMELWVPFIIYFLQLCVIYLNRALS